uniref:Uncharacterized protein n=1 Tax=Arundo donax TaxID=35708 RepID=A0A0A9AFM8_ARUDO
MRHRWVRLRRPSSFDAQPVGASPAPVLVRRAAAGSLQRQSSLDTPPPSAATALAPSTHLFLPPRLAVRTSTLQSANRGMVALI